MDNEKKLMEYVGGRGWTWIAGLALMAVGILIFAVTDSVLILLAIVLMFVGVFYLLRALTVDLPAIRRGKKCLNQLKEKGLLDQAAAELSAFNGTPMGRDKTIFTEHFIFGYRNGVALSYQDILWVYKRRFTQRVMGLPVKTVDSLSVSAAGRGEMCAVNMGRRDKHNELDSALSRICEHNPKALVGYTPENKKRCKELLKG